MRKDFGPKPMLYPMPVLIIGTYGAEEVGGQLRALQENGLDGGFMAWNAMCSIPKFETLKPAFDALPD